MLMMIQASTTKPNCCFQSAVAMNCTIVLIVAVVLINCQCSWAKDNHTAILANIKNYDSCVLQSTFTFNRDTKSSNPPKTIEELKATCKSQTAAFKCIKEKTRDAQPIIRRGLLSYVASRQRYHKKYCANPDSGLSKKYVEDIRCNIENRAEPHERVDFEFEFKLRELFRRNYNDSKAELKLLCCTFVAFIQQRNAAIGKECASTSATIDELARSVIPEEMNLICDDEEKLAKTCANAEQIVVAKDAKPKRNSGISPSALGLFLIATLGEPQDVDVKF